jgi:D-alanyl-D-alanine dipeptidase
VTRKRHAIAIVLAAPPVLLVCRDLANRLQWWLFIACLCMLPASAQPGSFPGGFVYVEEVIPDIRVELRYFTDDNFVGQRIDGYLRPRCILTREAAEGLQKVQEELKPFGLGLKIYDAYRPQQAVDHFVRWAKDLADARMKQQFYPNVAKESLFLEGYIAEKSSHSRGSTVDLTIVSLAEATLDSELDMGSGFDFFGPESWPENPSMSPQQRAHRLLLQALMQKHGYQPYPQEWWHFTLKREPFPESSFNFPIQ